MVENLKSEMEHRKDKLSISETKILLGVKELVTDRTLLLSLVCSSLHSRTNLRCHRPTIHTSFCSIILHHLHHHLNFIIRHIHPNFVLFVYSRISLRILSLAI